MSKRAVLEFEIRSDPALLPEVRRRLQAWALGCGWEPDAVAEIALAVSEALTNVIRHGYDGRCDQPICVRAEEIEDPQAGTGIDIVIRDFGRQVPPESIVGRHLDDVRPGGLGVHIIRRLMDLAEYTLAEGGGMRLHMRRFRTSAAGRRRSGESTSNAGTTRQP